MNEFYVCLNMLCGPAQTCLLQQGGAEVAHEGVHRCALGVRVLLRTGWSRRRQGACIRAGELLERSLSQPRRVLSLPA